MKIRWLQLSVCNAATDQANPALCACQMWRDRGALGDGVNHFQLPDSHVSGKPEAGGWSRVPSSAIAHKGSFCGASASVPSRVVNRGGHKPS